MPNQLRQRVFRGWWVVALTALMLTLMSVTTFQGVGAYLVALERQFNWSRTAISGAFSFARIQGAVIGPLEGYFVDRFGNKRMIFIGYTMIGLGFFLLSQIRTIWQFYGAFIFIAIGSSLGGWLPLVALVNNWFIRKRTLAMATAMSGIHFGGFLVPVLAVALESQGFRYTTLGIGVILLTVVIPVTKTISNRPEDIGLMPDGDPQVLIPNKLDTGEVVDPENEFTAKQALRTPAFWILTVVHLSSTISIVSLSLHLIPKLTDLGMTLSNAALVVLVSTAVALPSQFLVGFLADRLPKSPLLSALLLAQTVSLVIIAMADTTLQAYLFAILWGIGFGGRTPILTSIRGDYFGRKAFATILGLSQFPNNLTMIGAPLFAGYMFDTRGSYFIPFMTFAVFSLFGAALMTLVRKPNLSKST